MKATFTAFSLEHDPHIIVVTSLSPGGATLSKVSFKDSFHLPGGNLPKQGL